MFSAVMALVLLTSLLIAFAVLSKSEPSIAGNHARSLQARAMAESGVEQAIWALSSSSVNTGAAPYDGSSFVSVGTIGGFFVTIANGTATNEKVVDAVGWSPGNSTTGTRNAHRHVRLTLSKIKWLNPPAALLIEGNVVTSGNAITVSGAADTSCGPKNGAVASGSIYTNGTPTILGGGGAAPELQNVPPTTMDQYMFTNADLNMLKSIAKANGTYYQGSQVFNSTNPWPAHGLVFVDTADGQNLTCTPPGVGQTCTPAASDLSTVTIGSGGMPTLNGWLIVNGSIAWSGTATINGLVYAVNDIAVSGTPTVNGAVISKNLIDTSSTSIDSTFAGAFTTITIDYNCANTKNGGGTIPVGWFIKAGTYREVSD